MNLISILLADDHTLVRQGLLAMLQKQPDLEVVGEASDGIQALEMAASLKPEVILMDVMMPNLNGIEAAHQMQQRGLKTRIVFLSMHANPSYAVRALHSGALAYVVKDADFSEILAAIHNASEGRRYLSSTISDDVLEMLLTNGSDQAGALDSLSPRQREVLQLIAEGNTNANIALKLTISVRTVETHRAQIMARLHIGSHAELVRFAVQQGLVEA